MEGEQPQGAFMAFRLQPQGQQQRADAVEERVVQPLHASFRNPPSVSRVEAARAFSARASSSASAAARFAAVTG